MTYKEPTEILERSLAAVKREPGLAMACDGLCSCWGVSGKLDTRDVAILFQVLAPDHSGGC